MDTLTITKPDDFHAHLREVPNLEFLTTLHAKSFKRALFMPNLENPIVNAHMACAYKRLIESYNTGLEVLMTIYITLETTAEMIFEAHRAGVKAGKLYARGITTNSTHGVPIDQYLKLRPVFEAMEKVGMVLCLHGEDPNAYVMDGEGAFLKTLGYIHSATPDLKIVLEHVTSARAIDYVRSLSKNVAATITVHHLLLTTDDILKGRLHPDNFCMPVAKGPKDRAALLKAAFSGNPKFFLGTDSAPWETQFKYCANGCAGAFTSPVAIPLLAEIFDSNNCIKRMNDFTSVFGASYYGIPINEEKLSLIKQTYSVPKVIGVGWPGEPTRSFTPFWAGKKISFTIVE
jgi:dihydroorotase